MYDLGSQILNTYIYTQDSDLVRNIKKLNFKLSNVVIAVDFNKKNIKKNIYTILFSRAKYSGNLKIQKLNKLKKFFQNF